MSKTSDFGSGCSADGDLVVDASIYDKLLVQLQAEWSSRFTMLVVRDIRAVSTLSLDHIAQSPVTTDY